VGQQAKLSTLARFIRGLALVAVVLACAPAALAGPPAVAAQSSEPAEPSEALGYPTPLSVLRHFEQSMQRGDTDAALRCMDLSSIPPGVRQEIGERFALQLALALERLPPVSLEDQPKEDSLTLASTEVGDITLRRRSHAGGERLWQFASRTVEALPAIFRHVMRSAPISPSLALMGESKRPIDVLQWRAPEVALWVSLPESMKRQALGLELYQWLGLPLVALLAWVSKLIIEVPIHALLKRLAGRGAVGGEWTSVIGRCTHAAGWTVALQLAGWMVLLLGLPLNALDFVLLAVQVANVALVTRLAMQLADFAGAWLHSRQRDDASVQALDDLLTIIRVRLAKILVLTGAVVWIVSILGAENSVNRLLAGLGIGGIAFALALQEPLRNFFSSIVLAAERNFGVGDTLSFEGVQGKVEHVGFRTTTLRTKLETRLLVPNATMASTKIDANSGGALKEFKAVLPVAFEVEPAKLQAFGERAKALLREAPGVRAKSVEAGVSSLGAFGIEFAVTALFEKRDMPTWETFDGLNRALLQAAHEMGLPLRARA
jgi:MscS family membrane protein